MGTVQEGSKRLDKTLSSDDFANEENLSRIVKNQILKSSFAEDDGKSDPKEKLFGGKQIDEVTQYWSGKIWTFLDDLRSASDNVTGKLKPTDDNGGQPREWKLKDESARHRVMYREGPEGTPFHALCLDGVVDGDFASALCVAWESPLFKEWWPQFTVPTFKIIESKWLRRIRVGQDLSLLRFKVPWPVAQREVVMSVFEIEYFQEDLIIGLVESVPDAAEINENIHGFSATDLPPLSSHVRMDIGGGFVMQRKSQDQFFFRTILSLDMKLDFVPPWLINFISRQLASQGLKLYQKAVLAASNGTGSGKAFQKPLKTGYMYEKVRLGLESKKEANWDKHTSEVTEKPPPTKEYVKAKSLQGSIRRMGSSEYNRVVPYPVKADETKDCSVKSDASITNESAQLLVESLPEHLENRPVEEVKLARVASEEIKPDVAGTSKGVQASCKFSLNEDEVREYDDPEVVWAVNILDKMISYTRSCAADQVTTSESLENRVESVTLDSKEAVSGGAPVKDSRRPPAPPAKKENCNIVVVQSTAGSNAILKPDNIESSRSRGLQSSGGDAESSGHSSFWSTSEIEVISSQDDTDTDIGASGSSIANQPIVRGPEMVMKRKWRKWRWTCFSPSSSRKPVVHGKGNFYARDFGIGSEGQLRPLMEESGRYTNNNRGYQTDGDERHGSKHTLRSQGRSPDRFVTLGKLLLDGEH